MALPNWAGNTRYLGPTGPAGQNGVSGGQVFYFDAPTSTTVPTLGSLVATPVTTAKTTITYSASGTTVLLANFPTATGLLTTPFIPAGLWDFNIYMQTTSTVNSPSFYFSLYQVDSDGVSNPVLIADGSGGPLVIFNVAPDQHEYTFTLFVPSYTLTDSTKRLLVRLFGVYGSGGRSIIAEFRDNLYDHVHTTLAVVGMTGPTGPTGLYNTNWSPYPATTDVNLSNYAVNNASSINSVQTLTTTVDRGADVGGLASYSVVAQNGSAGKIDLTANAGFNNGTYGTINLTANGGVLSSVAQGGLINITANTPVGSTYTTTSAIKMSAAGVLSYAGAVSPLLSLLGYNYLYGTLGVNITANVVPPSLVVPNTAGTVFISGQAGTKCSNGLYLDALYNYQGQDLTISTPPFSGSNGNITVQSYKQLYLTATTGTGGVINMNGNTTNIQGNAGGLNLSATSGGNINMISAQVNIGAHYYTPTDSTGSVVVSATPTLTGTSGASTFYTVTGGGYGGSILGGLEQGVSGLLTLNVTDSGTTTTAIDIRPSEVRVLKNLNMRTADIRNVTNIYNSNTTMTLLTGNGYDMTLSSGNVFTLCNSSGSYFRIQPAGYIDMFQTNALSFYTQSNYWTVNGANGGFIQMASSGDLYFYAGSNKGNHLAGGLGNTIELSYVGDIGITTSNTKTINLNSGSVQLNCPTSANSYLNMNNNAIYNASNISSASLCNLNLTANSGNLTLNATGGFVSIDSPTTTFLTNNITQVGGIYNTTTGFNLNTATGYNVSLNAGGNLNLVAGGGYRIYARANIDMGSNSISNISNLVGNGSGTISGFNISDSGSGTITGVSLISNAAGVTIEATSNLINLDSNGVITTQSQLGTYITSLSNSVTITGYNGFNVADATGNGVQVGHAELTLNGTGGIFLNDTTTFSNGVTTTYPTPMPIPFTYLTMTSNINNTNLNPVFIAGSNYNWYFDLSQTYSNADGDYDVSVTVSLPTWLASGSNLPYPVLTSDTRYSCILSTYSNYSFPFAYSQGTIGNVNDVAGLQLTGSNASMNFTFSQLACRIYSNSTIYMQICFLNVGGSNIPQTGLANMIARRMA